MTTFHSIAAHATALCRSLCLLLALGSGVATAAGADQSDLRQAPLVWAEAATAGDMNKLMGLYSKEAFIHVVFTKDELHGYQEIFNYYEKYEKNPPKVSILNVDEAESFGGVGILSGKAKVEFPNQEPMTTHFSTVLKQENGRWVIQLQHLARIDGK